MNEAEISTLIIGLSFATTVPFQVYSAVMSSYQRYDLINLLSVSTIVLRTGLVVIFLLNGYGILTMAILYAFNEVVIRALSMVVGYRLMSGFQISRQSIDGDLLRHMVRYGLSTTLYMSGAVLVFKSADLIVASLISAAAVSRFFIATTPVLLLITLVQVFAQAMKPAVSELDALDAHDRIKEMALIAQKYTLLAIIPGVAFMIITGRAFLSVWIGDRFPEPGVVDQLAAVLQILAIGTGLRLTQHSNFIVLAGRGQHRTFGTVAAVMVVSCVALASASVLLFDAGLVGIAWGCCIPMAFVSTVVLPVHFSREMQIGLMETLKQSWLPAFAASFPALILISVWTEMNTPQSWFEIIFLAGGAAGLTGIGAWFFAMSPVERNRIRRILPF